MTEKDKEALLSFLEGISGEINKAKNSGMNAGVIIGALEVSKLKLFSCIDRRINNDKEEDEQWSETA